MKKTNLPSSFFIIFILLSFSTGFSFGQDSLLVSESTEMMSQGRQNGFVIQIPKISAKDSEKLWKKFMSGETKSSVKKEDGELVIYRALLKTFKDDTMNIFTVFKDIEGSTSMHAYFSGTDSVFISSIKQEAQSGSAKTLVRNFAVVAYKEGVAEELKEENEKLSTLNNELKEIDKYNTDSEDNIKKNKREIERQKSEITTLEKQEEFTSTEIMKQKQMLTSFVGSGESREIEEKKLKRMEKEKKQIQKDIENAHEEIDDLENAIKKMEEAIKNNVERVIPDKNQEIKNQKEVILNVETLLNNIK